MKVNLNRLFIALVLALAFVSSQARVFLVSAGVEDYSRFPQKVTDLPNTCTDAKGVQFVYDKNNAVTSLLLNRQATRQGILEKMESVFGMAQKDDIVVFFFSGHGLPGGICTSDGILYYDQLIKAMSKSKSNNKMLFIHSCHSGSIRAEATKKDNAYKQAKEGNVMLFLSSRGNQYSWTNPMQKFSYFVNYLQNGLRGKADVNRDRTITAKELYNYVVDGVTKETRGAQHPVMWGNFSDNMPVMVW